MVYLLTITIFKIYSLKQSASSRFVNNNDHETCAYDPELCGLIQKVHSSSLATCKTLSHEKGMEKKEEWKKGMRKGRKEREGGKLHSGFLEEQELYACRYM